MPFNWITLLFPTLVPIMVGYIWFSDKLFGAYWRKAAHLPEVGAPLNMVKILLFSLLFGVMLSVGLHPVVLHHFHVGSLLAEAPEMADPNSALSKQVAALIGTYAPTFTTFKHGAFHGFLTSIFIVLPIIGMISQYENRGWKYNLVIWGFWATNLTLMGGIICQFATL